MLKKTFGLIALVLFVAVGSAQAKVSITYETGGVDYFSMNIPDNWRVNVGAESPPSQSPDDENDPPRVVSVMPGDGMPLWFGIWVPKHLAKIEDGEDFMASLGLHLLDDVVVADRKLETMNSMGVYRIGGTGKKDGAPMDFRAAFIQLSPQAVVIAIYIGPHETTIGHGEELLQMIHSIQGSQQLVTR